MDRSEEAGIVVPRVVLKEWMAHLPHSQLKLVLAFIAHGWTGEQPGTQAELRTVLGEMGVTYQTMHEALTRLIEMRLVRISHADASLCYWLDLDWQPYWRP